MASALEDYEIELLDAAMLVSNFFNFHLFN
jgi:hypothetical protein